MTYDVDVRTRARQDVLHVKQLLAIMDSDTSRSSASSLSSSYESTDETALADCEGTQPYMFEPYDSEASSGTDSSSESEEQTFERLQNTDW